MANRLEIVAWNLRDGINDPQIQDSVLVTEPDIAVFPEAHAEDGELESATLRRFNNAGYALYEHDYEDNDGRLDRHALVVAAKPELVQVAHSVRIAGRYAIRLTFHDGSQFMGVHLDDRRPERRLPQARTVTRSLGDTAIIAGDFNDMFPDVGQAPVLRLARPLNVFPARDPEPGRQSSKLSYAQRLNGMARGLTIRHLTDVGFVDADPDRVPTMVRKVAPKLVVKAQLDHIMHRGDVSVVRPTKVEDAGGLSDHKRIRATLQVGR